MRRGVVVLLALLGAAAIVAGCGGRKKDTTYIDPYDEMMGKSGGRGTGAPGGTPAGPVEPGETPSTAAPRGPGGDPTGGGVYGQRITRGSGQSGEVSESDFKELASIGRDIMEAHKLHNDYFEKKRRDGTQDTSLLNRALSMLEQLEPRIAALGEKYPDNIEVQQQLSIVTEDLHALKYEK